MIWAEERGAGDPPLLLVHGIACDGRYLAPQAEALARGHRVVTVDLRGHGRSPAAGPYDVDTHLDDLVATCRERGLERPVVVGHSLGGVLALYLAAREPELLCGAVLLDAPVLPPPERGPAMRSLFARLRAEDYPTVLREYFARFFALGDPSSLRDWALQEAVVPPADGVLATWESAVFDRDDEACAAQVRCPLLYVDAGTPNARLDRLAELCPQLVLGRTVGAGHFLGLVVPDQVDAMIERFLDVSVADGP